MVTDVVITKNNSNSKVPGPSNQNLDCCAPYDFTFPPRTRVPPVVHASLTSNHSPCSRLSVITDNNRQTGLRRRIFLFPTPLPNTKNTTTYQTIRIDSAAQSCCQRSTHSPQLQPVATSRSKTSRFNYDIKHQLSPLVLTLSLSTTIVLPHNLQLPQSSRQRIDKTFTKLA